MAFSGRESEGGSEKAPVGLFPAPGERKPEGTQLKEQVPRRLRADSHHQLQKKNHSLRVVFSFEEDEGRLTSVADTENYDLSLYPIPRASSVPDDLREIVDNPIFSADELTMDAVWARAYTTDESGDSNGWRMAFSVRYGDTIVEVRTKCIDPEWVYHQLKNLITE